MAFTYDSNPAGIPRDRVRFLIGDTDREDPWFDDAEIAYLLSEAGGDPRVAAIVGIEALLSRVAFWQDETVGGVTLKVSDIRSGLLATLERLRNTADGGTIGAPPYVGGTSLMDKANVALDGDRVPTQYSVGMFKSRGSLRSRPPMEVLGEEDL